MPIAPEDVLNFWFYEAGRERWFVEDRVLDQQLRERFLPLYEQVMRGEMEAWKQTPEGTLALLLLLDQFPRRMFRGTTRAFEADEAALDLARHGIIKHYDDRIDRQFKLFFYLPFLNSENMGDQRLALFYIRERVKEEEWLERAEQKFTMIQRFGRDLTRDPLQGALSPEEAAFLQHAAPAGHA